MEYIKNFKLLTYIMNKSKSKLSTEKSIIINTTINNNLSKLQYSNLTFVSVF